MTTFAIFATIGAIGGAALLLTVIFDDLFDGVFDMFDGPDGLLSGRTVAAFFALFGAGGAIVTAQGGSLAVASAVGIAAGAAGMAAAWGIYRFFASGEQPDGINDTPNMVGLEGTIISGAKAGEYGRVSLSTVNSELLQLGCISDTAITAGQTVVVVAPLSSTSVKVAVVEQ